MSIKIKDITKLAALYIPQVLTLWGLLEGYTYFKGDALKNLLGPLWILIYIIPIFTTLYVYLTSSSDESIAKENISTVGTYSPGKVGGSYKIRQESVDTKKSATSNIESDEQSPNSETAPPARSIQTQGDYSPGVVEGDYEVEK